MRLKSGLSIYMANKNNTIHIEVVYAKSDQQHIIPLKLNLPADVLTAINQSNILKLCPEIDLKINKAGIYGEIVELSHPLKNHDRVEIYRPLATDPMAQRFERVAEFRKHRKNKHGP